MEFKYYSRRWGHLDTVVINWKPYGWEIIRSAIPEKAGKDGNPVIANILKNDGVSYPESLGGYLEYLWDHFNQLGGTFAQKELDVLFDWINETERNTPNTDFWKIYR